MNQFTINILLEYLYNIFAVTFLMCLIGSIIRETMISINTSTLMSFRKILASSIFSTILMCAVAKYFKVAFEIYIFLCVMAGLWSIKIIYIAMDLKIVKSILRNLFKNYSDPVSNALSGVLEKDEEERIEEKKDDIDSQVDNHSQS